MGTELLSAVELSNAKPGDKRRKLRDGNGLIVLVHPNGSRYFQLCYNLARQGKDASTRPLPRDATAEARTAVKAACQLRRRELAQR